MSCFFLCSSTHFPQLCLSFVQYFQSSAFRSVARVCSLHQIKRLSGRHQKHVAYGREVLLIVILGISRVTGGEASIFSPHLAFTKPLLWNSLCNKNRLKWGTKNCLAFEFCGKVPTLSKCVVFFVDQCMGMALKINTFNSNGDCSLGRRGGWMGDFNVRAHQT